MDFLSFKKMRLFKSQPSPPDKNHTPLSGPQPVRAPILKNFVGSPFVLIFVFVLVLAYLIAYLPSRSLRLPKEGAIATADIIAPADLTIEDAEATLARRQEVQAQVLPIYVFNQNVQTNTETKVRQFFLTGRGWLARTVTPAKKIDALGKALQDKFDVEAGPNDLGFLVKMGFPPGLEDALLRLLSVPFSRGILVGKNLFFNREPERGLTLVKTGEERPVKVEEVLDMGEAKDLLYTAAATLEFPGRTKAVLANLAALFLTPNITFDQAETKARQERAAGQVEPVFYRIKRGKVLVRKGDEVTADVLRQVRIINSNLRGTPSWFINFAGTFLFLALMFLTLWYYLKSLMGVVDARSRMTLLGLTLIASLLVYKLCLFLSQVFSQNTAFPLLTHSESYAYAFPFQFGVLIFAFLTTVPVSLMYVIINSLTIGYLFRADFFLMIFSLIGGLGAMYGVKYFGRQKRTTTLRAGLLVIAPVNVFMVIALLLVREDGAGLSLLASSLLMALLGGVLSAALAFVLLPFVENAFGFVTQPRLLDLTNSDLPVLKQLALEAPGSYHHSLLVATLAEKAAEAIRLDPLLVKAGAMYHDIGKLKRPEYFIENRTRNVDTHRDLTPAMSALVIINHVKDGAEMAKKLRLPKALQEIIEQHHGTSLVRFFFQKAKEKYDPEMHDIEEEQYRYPGPSPRTKEAALVLLADSVEAASKSLRSPTETHFKRVISAIIDGHIQDGQLDDCNFSLKELKTIASSFLETLDSIFHPRVDYPGYDFQDKQKPKNEEKNGNGRNPEPPDEIPGQ